MLYMLTTGEDASAGGFLRRFSSRQKVWYWSSVSNLTVLRSKEEQEESVWYLFSTAASTGNSFKLKGNSIRKI